MIKGKYDLAFALRRCAEALTALNDDDLTKLSDENYSIEIKFSRRRNKSPTETDDKNDIQQLSEKLISIDSRDQAFAFLNSNFKTKKRLETIARQFDIPILKSDKLENLTDKIVEATVGARKRSQAIQGYSKPNVQPDHDEKKA